MRQTASGILCRVPARETRGMKFLDLVFAIALLLLLVYLVRLDWEPDRTEQVPAVHGATHSSWTSV